MTEASHHRSRGECEVTMSELLCADYSNERASWCVFRKENDISMLFLWKCHNENAAKKLAADVNSGTAICKGCKELGTNCGKCVKCELST